MKSGSSIVMATHLATHPSPICIYPNGPTAMPPKTFMASIPNSRLNSSSLPRTTNRLILAELYSFMDTVIIAMLQHEWDIHLSLLSSKTSTDLRLRLFMNSRYQSAQNTASHQHKCLPPGVLYLHLGSGEGWC